MIEQLREEAEGGQCTLQNRIVSRSPNFDILPSVKCSFGNEDECGALTEWPPR
jgi:hypothetical protein